MANEPEGVSGEVPTSGGMLRATIVPGDQRNLIGTVSFTGIPAAEGGALKGLQEVLAGCNIDMAPAKIEEFFTKNPDAATGIAPAEFHAALSLAFMKLRLASSSAPDPSAWKKRQT